MELNNKTLYIVMPAYNEAENIAQTVNSWYKMLDFGNSYSRLVIADGGSKDDTVKILRDLQKTYPKLEISEYPGTDHGTKVILLYKYAIEKGADWIFQTDSDGQTEPLEFPDFWNLKEKYDCILGNRVKRGDGSARKIIENGLRMYLLFFFGTLVPDANAPFRLMSADVIKKYITLMPENFALPNAFLSACFSKFNEKTLYKEITFKPRAGGVNYINYKRIMHYALDSIGSFYKMKKILKTAYK